MELVGNLFGMRFSSLKGIGVPLLLLIMLAMMVMPLLPIFLDIFFTFNISLALVVLLAGVYSQRPLEFAVFPTVLLLATLLRLALNVASTRVVLLEGHTGTDAAGKVIEAFGDFVVGGNYAVGLVVFAILVIINFVVVTKGAGRISEVSARFTLDAMPGKQMAIDADLNAGLINQKEAQDRRNDVVQEADFYGAMDGASKFVRGDAVAGILIMFINIIGGFAVGMLQHDMTMAMAIKNYTLLTIGDGLVAQIPSLVLSTAAAIMVTRVSSKQDMSGQILQQLFSNPKTLIITGLVIGIIGLVPGMPNLVFIALAVIAGAAGYYMYQKRTEPVGEVLPLEEIATPEPEMEDISWDDVQPVDTIGLEVGYRLIPLVDKSQGGQLMQRIKGVRRKLTQELGFLIPSVHIRDNLDLMPNAYRITIMGVTAGESEVFPEKLLAINPGQVFSTIDGIATHDPAFNLDAIWIEKHLKEQAQTSGYTVVDPDTVIATHLSQLLQNHASQLLGREEVQQLLESLSKSAPKIAEDLVPDILPLGVVVRVLQNLLDEQVSIRDIRTIVDTLAEYASRSQDPAILTTAVREALGGLIVQNINGIAKDIPVITLDHSLEQMLHESMQVSEHSSGGLEPGLADRLLKSLSEKAQQLELTGQPVVFLVSQLLRPVLAKFVRPAIPGIHVLSYNEIPDNRQVRIVAVVGAS